MTIYRVEHKRGYTTVNNFICKDKRLSWKAKGVWLYAFSRPDDWEFNQADLINQSTDGREAVRSALNELEATGYLVRDQKREGDGKFSTAEWVFYEVPEDLNKCVPNTGNTSTEKATSVNRPLLSTEKTPSTEKQQQEPAVVVSSEKIKEEKELRIYPILRGLSIPIHDMVEITGDYSEEEVNYAVNWAMHVDTEINKGLPQAIKWACRIKPKMPQSATDKIAENKAYAKKYDGITNGPDNIEALNKYVIINIRGASESPAFTYDTPKFIDKFKKALMKRNFKVLEES